MSQPFFAIRVVIRHDNGGTSTRDYVRGARHMGRDTFRSFAMGDMISLCTDPGDMFSITSEEISFATVAENWRYGHTTH